MTNITVNPSGQPNAVTVATDVVGDTSHCYTRNGGNGADLGEGQQLHGSVSDERVAGSLGPVAGDRAGHWHPVPERGYGTRGWSGAVDYRCCLDMARHS